MTATNRLMIYSANSEGRSSTAVLSHQKRTEDVEGEEVRDGEVTSTVFISLRTRPTVTAGVGTRTTGIHDLLPGFSCRRAKQQQRSVSEQRSVPFLTERERAENWKTFESCCCNWSPCPRPWRSCRTSACRSPRRWRRAWRWAEQRRARPKSKLSAAPSFDERQIRTHLKWFDECPEQSSNAFATTQHFHQAHHTKQTKEIDADHIRSRLRRRTGQHSSPLSPNTLTAMMSL